MLGSKFYLDFKSRPDIGLVPLNSEPIGLDSADFAIIQEEGRMGRDMTFAGGTGNFKFSRMMHPEVWDNIQNTIELQGFEAVINLGIDYGGNGNILIIGNLDLFTCDNDTCDIIATDVILDQDQSKIKKNAEANTDLFSDEDIDGGDIEPVDVARILIKAKPLNQLSNWESSENPVAALAITRISLFNPEQYITDRVGANNGNVLRNSGIDDTLSFLSPETVLNNANGGIPDLESFSYVEFRENASNVKINITDIIGDSRQVTIQNAITGAKRVNTGNGYVSIQIRVGYDMQTATVYNLWQKNHDYKLSRDGISGSNTQQTPFPTSLELSLPYVERNKRIWIYVNPDSNATFTTGSGTISSYSTIGSLIRWNIQIKATLTAYSSVNNAVRLRDAVAYNAMSAGNTTISFPMAEQGGVLYNNYILNGNLLRNVTDKPFYLTFKDVREGLTECNIDYEIENDGKLFFGTDKNYFPNVELGVFDVTPYLIGDKTSFEGFRKNFNEAFGFNLFEYKFKNFQSQKENDIANTYDGVHGETQYKLFNQNVSNKKEISVGFIRDAFLLEDNRTKALSLKNNTATQDDDKIFILDVYPKNRIAGTTITFNESDTLFHEYNDTTDILTLKNQGNFNFILLGILAGYKFRITSTPNPQFNQGLWTVLEVSSNFITLQQADGTTTHTSANNGERYTNFEYYIKVADIDGINWTNEDFTQIDGIANPSDFSNLKFTLGRNVQNYYGSVLATANLFHKEVAIRNLFYKNNPDAITTFEGVTVREGENFIPEDPLLTPYLVTTTLIMTFDIYYELMQKLRSPFRGFLRCFDPHGKVLRVYPQDMRFKASAETFGTVTLIGQLKYEPFLINISTVEEFNLVINNEYRTEFLKYEVKNNYFYIKDENGLLLYNKLTFEQIAINGAKASSVNQLRAMLDQYTEI